MAIIILCIVALVVGYEIFVKQSTNECVVNVGNRESFKQEEEKIEVYIVGCVKKPGVYEVKKGTTVGKIANQAGGFTKEADLERINLVHKINDNVMLEIKSKSERVMPNSNSSVSNNNVSKSNVSKSNVSNNNVSNNNVSNNNVSNNNVSNNNVSNNNVSNNNVSNNNASNNKPAMKIVKGIYEEESVDDVQVNINTADKEKLSKLPGIGNSVAEKIVKYREENGAFETIDDLKNVSGIGESKFNKIKDMLIV